MTAEAAARMEMKVFIVSLVSSYREISPFARQVVDLSGASGVVDRENGSRSRRTCTGCRQKDRGRKGQRTKKTWPSRQESGDESVCGLPFS